jgi:hypothetical protein
MSAINTISRRSFVSTVVSVVATGASFTMFPKVDAAAGTEAHPSLVQGGHHTDDEMTKCIQLIDAHPASPYAKKNLPKLRQDGNCF